MFFRKIRLENFRSHVDTTLELDRLTFIRGTNAAGKSSVGQAIQTNMAGTTDGLTRDGKGSIGLIRAGSNKSLITLAVKDGEEERILKTALSGTSKTTLATKAGDPNYNGNDYLDSIFLQKDVFSCLTNNRFFVDLKEDEQKDILARIILPKTYVWPDWLKPLCFDLNIKVDWNNTPFDIIEQAYAAAFKERTNVNRDVKNFHLPEGDVSQAEFYPEYQKRLEDRLKELDEAKKKKSAMEGDSKANAAALSAAQERLTSSQGRLGREQQLVPGIEAGILSAAKVKELEKSAKSLEAAGKLDAELATLDVQIAEKKKQISAISDMSEIPSCPTCGTQISPELIQSLAGPLMEDRNRMGARRVAVIDERKSLGNPVDAKNQLDTHAKAKLDLERAKDRIREEQTAIRDAEVKIAELNAASVQVADTSEVDAAIDELKQKVTKGGEVVSAARTAVDLAKRIDTSKKDQEKLLKSQAGLNRLVTYFDEEVKNELLSGTVGAFAEMMNDVMAKFGYTIELSIEPYIFAIIYRDAKGTKYPIALKHMSVSERYRFSTAFQVALAITTGLRFVIVDYADIFDPKAKAALFEAITSGDLDQAIVLATDVRIEVPTIEGAVFYRFEDVAEEGFVPETKVTHL